MNESWTWTTVWGLTMGVGGREVGWAEEGKVGQLGPL